MEFVHVDSDFEHSFGRHRAKGKGLETDAKEVRENLKRGKIEGKEEVVQGRRKGKETMAG